MIAKPRHLLPTTISVKYFLCLQNESAPCRCRRAGDPLAILNKTATLVSMIMSNCQCDYPDTDPNSRPQPHENYRLTVWVKKDW